MANFGKVHKIVHNFEDRIFYELNENQNALDQRPKNQFADDDGRINIIENCYVSKFFTAYPAEELVFYKPCAENKESVQLLSLRNTCSKNLSFKVKSTSPSSYRVQPSEGLIRPFANVDINIFLHPNVGPEVINDRFQIKVMQVQDEITDRAQLRELWQDSTQADKQFEYRLRVVLSGDDREKFDLSVPETEECDPITPEPTPQPKISVNSDIAEDLLLLPKCALHEITPKKKSKVSNNNFFDNRKIGKVNKSSQNSFEKPGKYLHSPAISSDQCSCSVSSVENQGCLIASQQRKILYLLMLIIACLVGLIILLALFCYSNKIAYTPKSHCCSFL